MAFESDFSIGLMIEKITETAYWDLWKNWHAHPHPIRGTPSFGQITSQPRYQDYEPLIDNFKRHQKSNGLLYRIAGDVHSISKEMLRKSWFRYVTALGAEHHVTKIDHLLLYFGNDEIQSKVAFAQWGGLMIYRAEARHKTIFNIQGFTHCDRYNPIYAVAEFPEESKITSISFR